MEELERLHEFARSIDVPMHFLSREEIARQEPDVRAEAGVLESPTTGIIDSHAFMAYLEGSFEERGGEEVLNTIVTKIERLGGMKEMEVVRAMRSTRIRVMAREAKTPSRPRR